jgi:Pyruvate/2-oxoacid:ferredoxin oxidoreductase delta subunit
MASQMEAAELDQVGKWNLIVDCVNPYKLARCLLKHRSHQAQGGENGTQRCWGCCFCVTVCSKWLLKSLQRVRVSPLIILWRDCNLS